MKKIKEIFKSKVDNIIFIGSATTFNLAVSGVYIASKLDNQSLLKVLGAFVVLLVIPFTISLMRYIKAKAKKKIIVSHVIILFYLFVEVLLDYILKIPFRKILVIHVPYIIIFYAAVFSMIGISRTLGKKAVMLVLSTFFVLMGSLIYYLFS